MGRHDLLTETPAGRAGAAAPRPSGFPRTDDAAAAATGPDPGRHADRRTGTRIGGAGATAEGGGRSERAMDRKGSLLGRTLAELDADPAADALRERCAAATPGQMRALRGEWTAAVVRALWRASASAGGGARR